MKFAHYSYGKDPEEQQNVTPFIFSSDSSWFMLKGDSLDIHE